MIYSHDIRVFCEGAEITGWKSYSIETDVLTPSDGFSLSLQFTKELWNKLKLDSEISIFIDETRILNGFIGERSKSPSRDGGTNITIAGRDRVGRLVDESAPLVSYGNLRIKSFVESMAGEWFDSVVLQNTRNRSLFRSVKARKAKTYREPIQNVATGKYRDRRGPLVNVSNPLAQVLVGNTKPLSALIGGDLEVKRQQPPIVDAGFLKATHARRVRPGSSRWQVIEEVLREARLIAWASADGRTLFVGLPNFDQEDQYSFIERENPSQETNATIGIQESIEELYSVYTCTARKRKATVKDNSNTTDGTGLRFQRPKRLLFTDDNAKSQSQVLERAEREQLQRQVDAFQITVNVAGHSQILGNSPPTIYAVDTMARVMDESTGIDGSYYVTSVSFERSRGGGTTSTLKLVPKGTLLQL